MRLLLILITGCVIAVLSGCTTASDGKENQSEASDQIQRGLDTLVYSAPENYALTRIETDSSNLLEIRTHKDMFELFERLNYTPEAWQAGIREIPRVYLPLIGERWGKTGHNELTVENKKRLFFRSISPLVLRANELILTDRNRLEALRSSYMNEVPLREEDQAWILKLAALYKVQLEGDQITSKALDALWEKVDIIPVSLALAQAAEESGWGTSRFAALGNAVYGQWTWGKNAIKPEQQREELGNYGIASFESLQESVCAYMLNLNTHNAYASLRDKRAELRSHNEKITGYVLAGQLTKYSERGEEYVKSLRSLMEYNLLSPADDAYLTIDPPIYLIPVAE
jgi:uncharacterized FlgJ-related protein